MIDDSVGLVKGAQHPAEAKAFIEYVGSAEAQQLAAREAFRLPARTDLPAASASRSGRRDVLRDLVPADVDWELIARNGQAWMTTWDRTVRSHGGGSAVSVATSALTMPFLVLDRLDKSFGAAGRSCASSRSPWRRGRSSRCSAPRAAARPPPCG